MSNIIYIASKVKHHYNNYYIAVYYIYDTLLMTIYFVVFVTCVFARATIPIRMPFDRVQDLRCPVITPPTLFKGMPQK